MLNKGIVSLTILIDTLIQLLTILEWVNPLANVLILLTVGMLFKSRWTWQVIMPSTAVYFYPALKSYVQRLLDDIEDKGKLDQLLTANSLSQHALFLKDRLLWLYSEEISFILEALKGDLSFQTRLTIISLITLFFGFFNLSVNVLQVILLHLLLKHSRFGTYYRILLKSALNFIDQVCFYQSFYKYSDALPPPFRLEEDDLIAEIVETIDINAKISFTSISRDIKLDLDTIKNLKPVFQLMTEEVSGWQEEHSDRSQRRLWKWTRTLKYDYSAEEWEIIKFLHSHIRLSE